MRAVVEFFVDANERDLKRIVVRTVGWDQYALDFYTRQDKVWQDGPQEVEINGKSALVRRLIREGVPEATVHDDLAMAEEPEERNALSVIFASLVMWLVIGIAGLALARWLFGLAF